MAFSVGGCRHITSNSTASELHFPGLSTLSQLVAAERGCNMLWADLPDSHLTGIKPSAGKITKAYTSIYTPCTHANDFSVALGAKRGQ